MNSMEKRTKATIQTETRASISDMYKAGKDDELVLRTFDLISAALSEGFNTAEISIRLIDLGVKPTEITSALILALEKYPTEKLNDKDKAIQKFCKEMNDKEKLVTWSKL